MKDFHSILGVKPGVSAEDLKKQYRKLAMEHHPDRGGNEDKFKEINEAYTALSSASQKSTDDILNDFLWESVRQRQRPRRVRYHPSVEGLQSLYMIVTVDNIRNGNVFDFPIQRSTPCKFCPEFSINKDCGNCQGYGFTNSVHNIKVKVEEAK